MKTLVVFYSRTGHTREVGHRIASALHADLEELSDTVNRRGILGYLRSGREAWLKRRVELRPLVHDPAAYDLVIVGTPIWNMSVSSPVRTFLQDYGSKLHEVAFFCTMGGTGHERAFTQMKQLSRTLPIAQMALTERDLKSPDLPTSVRSFVYKLKMFRHAA